MCETSRAITVSDQDLINTGKIKQPLVSVIMNCRNGEKYLREAIDSIFAQTYGNWEIVFFDNASTDGSGAIARSYGEKVRYYRCEEKLSLGAARNAAIAQANGQLIAILDTDDRWLPNKLALQVPIFMECAEIGFVYSNYYLLNDVTGKTSIGLHGAKPEGKVFHHFLGYYPVNLQTVMIRGSCLGDLDEMFDPNLEYAEEYDLFMRLLYSTQAKYLKQATAVYRVHGNMLTHKLLDIRPLETAYCLEKLRKQIPDIDTQFPRGVALFGAKVAYFHAVAFMSKGNKKSAREVLKSYKWFNPAFFILYLSTFFPGVVWRAILKLREKVK